MKILYLTFYFEPDLSAGSFRNTSLAKALVDQLNQNDSIDLITTFPNRYKSYKQGALDFEDRGILQIHRIKVPVHKNGFLDQINSFRVFWKETIKLTRKKNYDIVFASSSRLFTAYLGYVIAKRNHVPLYLDIRDIFVDTIEDVLKNKLIKIVLMPFIKIIEQKTFNHATHINLISAGFYAYFKKFRCNSYSCFTNGIDEEFIEGASASFSENNIGNTILYAGNIGEGQGLEKIIPQSAAILGDDYTFIIIGDGGTKSRLVDEVEKRKLKNVEFRDPIGREELKKMYRHANFMFLHLNNYKAFEKVLPSKIFELASYNKPIIAGVSGFAYQFIRENISNVILFQSCDVKGFIDQLTKYSYKHENRTDFINHFRRQSINNNMAESIIGVIAKTGSV